MDLLLKRAQGYFFADLHADQSTHLPFDIGDDGGGGRIDFTTRSSAQQRLLVSYDTSGMHLPAAVIYSWATF